ncbi:TetR family transcriptional regulator [Mycobacterium sp. NPDC051804]|uniref:acyl-CoA-like ligand-binding transcription factor n=1 Tax=Mycobacterium sp. NPDC051804 TaxID=3364295 RepID=UPI00378F1BB6
MWVQPATGLRDRKKIQTRDAIRREAMRLIKANGYANTNIEQIAAAAEVAPSTFFRYFPTKESVLITNDLDKVMLDTLTAQPADMAPFKAFRYSLETTWATASEAEWEFERARLQVVLSVPELKAAQLDEYNRTAEKLAAAEAQRSGRDPGDLQIRVFVGAMTGALVAALEGDPAKIMERTHRTLDFMESGMRFP